MPLLEARERWSRSEIETLQLERLNAVWRHAVAHTPHYARLRAAAELPDRFSSLAEFQEQAPVLTKDQVASGRRELLSRRAGRGHWWRTSGSTGTPLSVFRPHAGHLEMLRAKYRFYALWGHDIFDRMAWLWGTQDTSPPGLRSWLMRRCQDPINALRNRLRLPASGLGRADLQDHLSRIQAFRPAALYGLSRAVFLLAMEAEAECDSIKLVNLTGEPASANMLATVERAFRAPAIMEYGCVELGFVAGQWPDRTLRVREDIVLVETLPRADGLYDILLSDLTNPSFPLLRYQIGDVVDRPLLKPESGFAVLSHVAGRDDDLITTQSGRLIHPVYLDEMFELESEVPIRRYRLHQQRDGSITAAIELSGPASPASIARLEQKLSQVLEGFPARLALSNHLPQLASGKHRLVTSDRVEHRRRR